MVARTPRADLVRVVLEIAKRHRKLCVTAGRKAHEITQHPSEALRCQVLLTDFLACLRASGSPVARTTGTSTRSN